MPLSIQALKILPVYIIILNCINFQVELLNLGFPSLSGYISSILVLLAPRNACSSYPGSPLSDAYTWRTTKEILIIYQFL
ncbi:hypothetical protein UT300005_16940 [Clostridium sp. CTA-5]